MKTLNIIKAFILLVVLVGLVTTFFLSEFISAVIIGSVFNTVNPAPESIYVTADPFTGNRTVPQQLSYTNITQDTITIYNSSDDTFGLDNFTIDYAAGTVLVN